MTKLAPLATALLLGVAGTALAQQPQPRPQPPDDQRPRAEEHDSTGRTLGRGDTTGIGEQHSRPAGDALARPADPNAPPPDGMKPTVRKGDTAATSAKTGVGTGSIGEDKGTNTRRPSTAERPVGPDESHRVDPGGHTPVKRADDARNNPPPGSSGSSGQPPRR